jgi:hypothetical protein
VWCLALALLVADWLRRLVASWRDPGARRALLAQSWALGGVGLLALFVMPFFYIEAEGLVFGAWRGYLTSNRVVHWVLVCTAANLVLFIRPRRGLAANAVALVLVGLVVAVSFDAIAVTPKARLLLAALLGAAAVATRVWPRAAGAGVAAALTNAALLVAFRATVVLDERGFFQLQLLLAALALSAWVSDALGRQEDRASFANWLQVMALLVATWSTLALSLQRLEWHILYELFSPPFVEKHVAFFLPVIVGRYAIPLVIARRLLAESRPAGQASAWYSSFGAASVKLVTLLLVTIGYGLVNPSSEIYLEAVQNVLAFSAPLLALAYEPGRPAFSAGRT